MRAQLSQLRVAACAEDGVWVDRVALHNGVARLVLNKYLGAHSIHDDRHPGEVGACNVAVLREADAVANRGEVRGDAVPGCGPWVRCAGARCSHDGRAHFTRAVTMPSS